MYNLSNFRGLITLITLIISFNLYGNLGLGIYLGSPTGLCGDYTFNNHHLFMKTAWKLEDNRSFYFSCSYINDFSTISFDNSFKIDTSWGAGLGYSSRGDSKLSIILPLGVSHTLEEHPISFFLTLEPGLSIINSSEFNIGGGAGFIYHFHRFK